MPLLTVLALLVALPLVATLALPAFAQQSGNPTAAQVIKVLGKIKTVQSDSLTVTPVTGADATATLSAATKILQVEPGAKDLKSAIPLQAKDLQTGDSVRVRGYATADGKSINALEVIVFKQADVAAKQQQQREDWQKRGIDGTVSAIDASAGTITITRGALAAKQTIVLHVSKTTVLRRYAPGSVNFDDAKPAAIDQIKVGDQLNALGNRSSNANEITAEEIVSGTFNYIEGVIKSIDASNNTMTVEDPVKKVVVLKVSSDSLLKKLPPEAAQRIAARLKAGTGENGNQAGASATGPNQTAANQPPPNPQSPPPGTPPMHAGAGAGGAATGEHAGANGNGGPPDLQRILARLPNSTLADFQKDDAVMIVATGDAGNLTAIKVLAGVDAILRAAPNRSASSLLSSWSLSGSGGEGEGTQ